MVLNDNECDLILADNSGAHVRLIQSTLERTFFVCSIEVHHKERTHTMQMIYRKKRKVSQVRNSVTA